jgi:hypothetical protein
MAKLPCPISVEDFLAQAQPVEIDVAGTKMTATPRKFSTGSFGWYLTGKATLMVEGKAIPVQVGTNLTVIGSKDAGKE